MFSSDGFQPSPPFVQEGIAWKISLMFSLLVAGSFSTLSFLGHACLSWNSPVGFVYTSIREPGVANSVKFTVAFQQRPSCGSPILLSSWRFLLELFTALEPCPWAGEGFYEPPHKHENALKFLLFPILLMLRVKILWSVHQIPLFILNSEQREFFSVKFYTRGRSTSSELFQVL